jgi:predicted type IV restriction endonuclease
MGTRLLTHHHVQGYTQCPERQTWRFTMASVPAKAIERIRNGLKRFQPILSSAKARDVNESDTVVIVTDLLQYVFGYDKYSEITSEHMIRGTYCDLAVKIDGALAFLLEVKAIGSELKDSHIKQAIDYAANQGVDWVGLTNGTTWRIYKVTFTKPIQYEAVVEFDMLSLSHRDSEAVELLALLAKEGWQKAHIGEYHSYRQALSKYTLSAILLSESVLKIVRRQLRGTSPGLKVELDEIKSVLEADVIKREVLEGEKAISAQRQVTRANKKARRNREEAKEDPNEDGADSTGTNTILAPLAVAATQ